MFCGHKFLFLCIWLGIELVEYVVSFFNIVNLCFIYIYYHLTIYPFKIHSQSCTINTTINFWIFSLPHTHIFIIFIGSLQVRYYICSCKEIEAQQSLTLDKFQSLHLKPICMIPKFTAFPHHQVVIIPQSPSSLRSFQNAHIISCLHLAFSTFQLPYLCLTYLKNDTLSL